MDLNKIAWPGTWGRLLFIRVRHMRRVWVYVCLRGHRWTAVGPNASRAHKPRMLCVIAFNAFPSDTHSCPHGSHASTVFFFFLFLCYCVQCAMYMCNGTQEWLTQQRQCKQWGPSVLLSLDPRSPSLDAGMPSHAFMEINDLKLKTMITVTIIIIIITIIGAHLIVSIFGQLARSRPSNLSYSQICILPLISSVHKPAIMNSVFCSQFDSA